MRFKLKFSFGGICLADFCIFERDKVFDYVENKAKFLVMSKIWGFLLLSKMGERNLESMAFLSII
jgi:hypothetical protein